MLYVNYIMMDSLNRLKTLNSTIKLESKESDMDGFKSKFNAMAYDLALSTCECATQFNISGFNVLYENLMNRIAYAKSLKDPGELKLTIDGIVALYKDIRHHEYTISNFDRSGFTYNNNMIEKTQFDLSEDYSLKNIYLSIESTDRPVTLFYPDSGNAENIHGIYTGHNFLKYCNEFHEGRLSVAKTRVHKGVKGMLKGSRIQNNAFDIVYTQPAINVRCDHNDAFSLARKEKLYIADLFKYIRPGGLLIITLPHTRLFKDTCLMLSRYLNNIQVVKSSDKIFRETGLVHIIGQKDLVKNAEVKTEEYSKLRKLYNRDLVSDGIKGNYKLPSQYIPIELFKGSELDMEEVENILSKSALTNKLFEEQKVVKIGDSNKEPLLPFNIGQLGLVLTSGCLDGVVTEGDGNYHLIKGRVVKRSTTVEEKVGDTMEVIDTSTNKVEINIVLPNGEMKTLA